MAEIDAHEILTGSAFNKTVEVTGLTADNIKFTWSYDGKTYTYEDE